MISSSPSDVASRERATTALDRTILVEAGAGSGKTTVLTNRLLSLLRSGRGRIERIAAITFSEKAAAELRIRLRTDLEVALAGPLPENERASLRLARTQLDRAVISTIHAFCSTLLRERPVEARVDPGFTVLDAVESSLLQAELWRAWLVAEMERSPLVLKQALQANLTLAHLEALRDFLLAQRDCLGWLPASVTVPLAEMQTSLLQARDQLHNLADACTNPQDRAYQTVQRLETLFPVGNDHAAWERFLLHESQDLFASATIGAKSHWQPATVLNEVRTLLKQMKEHHSRARAAWLHNLTVGVAHWLAGYLQAYEEKKRERSQLDFTDLLIKTRDLLQTNREIRRYFQRKFDFLYVDELQDTDPLQAEIIFFLAEREAQAKIWTEVALAPGKLFLVGDPQQAIYRFRRADVDVYAQVRALIERQGEVVALSANFRTRASVLTWMNETFTHLFAEGGSEQPQYRPLTATRQESTGREVIFLPVPAGLLPATATREEQRVAEARTVAAFLKQTIMHRTPAVWGDRQVRYRDVAILFRTYQAMDVYEDTLRSAGLPARLFGGRRYSSRPEIEECRALLLAIAHPADTVALVAALRSRAFGFSDEELALLVSMGGKLDYLHEMVPEEAPAAARFRAAFALLRDFHALAVCVSPATLLSTLYDRTPLMAITALRVHGAQRVANLLKLVDLARAWSARGVHTLAAFNRYLAYQDFIEEEQEAIVTEEHEDAVRLLTIHKAKGLEFPVVVLADLASHQQERGGRAVGIVDRGKETLELRLGPRTLTCTTQGWQNAEAREQARDAAETQRLWYVAAARVCDHLIVPQRPQGPPKHNGAPLPVPKQSNVTATASSSSQTEQRSSYIYESDPAVIEQMLEMSGPQTPYFSISPYDGARHSYERWRQEHQARPAFQRQYLTTPQEDESGLQPQVLSSSTPNRRLYREALRQLLSAPQEREVSLPPHRSLTAPRHELARIVDLLHTFPFFARAQAATECVVALPFTLSSQHQLLSGEIDLAFCEDNSWIVVHIDERDSSHSQHEQHNSKPQPHLAWQAVALEQLTKRPVKELVTCHLQTQREYLFAWNEEVRQQLRVPSVLFSRENERSR